MFSREHLAELVKKFNLRSFARNNVPVRNRKGLENDGLLFRCPHSFLDENHSEEPCSGVIHLSALNKSVKHFNDIEIMIQNIQAGKIYSCENHGRYALTTQGNIPDSQVRCLVNLFWFQF
jgi:hypothetical protein